MVRKKKHGVGANCNVLMKYLHLAKYISEKFPNYTKRDRLQNCIAFRQEIKTVNKKNPKDIVMALYWVKSRG